MRKSTKKDWEQFQIQQGPWKDIFTKPLPPALEESQIEASSKELTLDAVSKWISSTGRHSARLHFFETYNTASPLYVHCAKKLLSMNTAGSIDVERMAKPLKNAVMAKTRCRAGLKYSEMLLRAGLNMRFLHESKTILKVNASAGINRTVAI